jgi:DNA-binding NarL/FixJ family response regulator
VLSLYADYSHRLEAAGAGAAAFVDKCGGIDSLVETIRAVAA